MNKIYRLVWNELINAWVAVSEITKAHGKRSSKALLISATAAVLSAPTFAQTAPPPNTLPTGGKVVAGTANITQSSATMNINQSSQRGVIDWGTFNIGSQATVNFIQPSSSAATLNRVLDPNPSQIFGRINANGQVFLTNASGIYFGKGASVNVGALTATTHGIGNADFMAGNLRFTRNGATGSVINEGNLTADLNGYIALLAPEVRNQGVVIAQAGTVAMAAGDVFELEFDNGRMTSIRVEPATIAALVENGNAVQAPGGLIILSARAADQLQGSVVRNSSLLEASSLVERGGVIRLEADHIKLAGNSQIKATGPTGGGEVYAGGGWQGGGYYQATTTTMEAGARIDVSATKVGDGGTTVLWSDLNKFGGMTRVQGSITAKGGAEGGDGGRIETSGHCLNMAGQIDLTAPRGLAGLLLLDPKNIIVASSDPGGATSRTTATTVDAFSDNSTETSWVTPSDLVTWLGTANVTLQASTDITINNAVDASSNTRSSSLTLYAGRDVMINADITLRGSFAAYSNNLAAGTANRDAGPGNFTMAAGTKIDTSTVPQQSIVIENQNTGTTGGKATVAGLRFSSGTYPANASPWSVNIKADQIDFIGGADSITNISTDAYRPDPQRRQVQVPG